MRVRSAVATDRSLACEFCLRTIRARHVEVFYKNGHDHYPICLPCARRIGLAAGGTRREA